jgi:hypothetical protein
VPYAILDDGRQTQARGYRGDKAVQVTRMAHAMSYDMYHMCWIYGTLGHPSHRKKQPGIPTALSRCPRDARVGLYNGPNAWNWVSLQDLIEQQRTRQMTATALAAAAIEQAAATATATASFRRREKRKYRLRGG